LVPVELRYETIVFEDGKLHIYRDVYDQNTNTEENLRAIFAANGGGFDDLGEPEKVQVLEALNAMSRHPGNNLRPRPHLSRRILPRKIQRIKPSRQVSERLKPNGRKNCAARKRL